MSAVTTPVPPTSAMSSKPILYIEVRLRDDATNVIRTDTIRSEVHNWIIKRYWNIRVPSQIVEFPDLRDSQVIESINIIEYTGAEQTQFVYPLKVQLDVQVYQLSIFTSETLNGDKYSKSIEFNGATSDDSEPPQYKIIHLPNKCLDGLWESLIFGTDLKVRMLRYVNRMMIFSNRNIDTRIISWNRLIMLHGPPGTGKSSLCRALAQKLSIRLSDKYLQGKLIEINSHTLFSKYFSESGKLVGKMFEDIETLADVEDDTFVCVLIDEVESLTGARKLAMNKNEPGDAVRATNALLTGIDRLREKRNVLIICTSNFLEAIDAAFIDRVDVKQYVGNPCAEAIYSIYETCFKELVRCEIVKYPSFSTAQNDSLGMEKGIYNICPYSDMIMNVATLPTAPSSILWELSQRSSGLSGRTLRRLPALALALHISTDPCSIDEALGALRKAVEEEKNVLNVDELLVNLRMD